MTLQIAPSAPKVSPLMQWSMVMDIPPFEKGLHSFFQNQPNKISGTLCEGVPLFLS
jgi:hypothetical protein